MNDWPFAGARWWKFDFHCHTPASLSDYGRGDQTLKSLTPREWLLACMKKELDCVVVTDHNSGEWIAKLKLEYQSMLEEKPEGFKELNLFPGVELSVVGGIHLLALFDPTKGRDDIFALLTNTGFPKDKQGTPEATTTKPFNEVVELIECAGGTAIPAHVDGPCGLFTEFKDGPTLEPILKNNHILAAEVIDIQYNYPEPYKTHKASWSRVVGSDAHTPDEIGRRSTWVKMGTPSIEGLKLALMDNDLSLKRFDVLPDTQPNSHADFVLKSLQISESKYCGRNEPLSVAFNPWLNCLIGGRGSGKSTLVEFLRLVFRRDKEIKELFSDEDSRGTERSDLVKSWESFNRIAESRSDKGVLTPETKITVECCLNGETFRLSWQTNPNGSLPAIQKWNDRMKSFENSPGDDITKRFPIQIFSQKQLYAMATKPEALLKIVDEAPQVDFGNWKSRYDQGVAQFRSLRAQQRELLVQTSEEGNLQGELQDVLSKLTIFEKGENAQLLKEYQVRQSQNREVTAFQGSLTENAVTLSDTVLETIAPDLSLFEEGIGDEGVRNVVAEYSIKTQQLNDRLTAIKTELHDLGIKFSEAIDGTVWKKALQATLTAYKNLVDDLHRNGVENPDEYGVYVQKKQSIEANLLKIQGLKKRIVELENMAKSELTKLDVLRAELSKKRSLFLENVLRGNLIVRVKFLERGDTEKLEQEFRRLIGKEDETFQQDILSSENDSGLLSPLVKQYSRAELDKVKNTVRTLRMSGSSDQFNAKFASHLKNKMSPEMLDDLDLWVPADTVHVEYCRDQKKKIWSSIEQGSPGQKTAAVLAFLLSHGSHPIVLDQPEDDLDNHLIYELVVEQIRRKKQNRQILIVTHNPNIVVNGDAELVHAMDFQNSRIVVTKSGCLQERKVRQEICQIMEGGTVAFERRYKRINIEGQNV